MAAYKFTTQRGKPQRKDVAVAAGTAEAQTDTMSLNIDTTHLRRSDVINMIEAIRQQVIASKWPPL